MVTRRIIKICVRLISWALERVLQPTCLVQRLLVIIGRSDISSNVLDNYQGSVLIQGMHDWNVDPHMAVPTMNALKDLAEIDAKGFVWTMGP